MDAAATATAFVSLRQAQLAHAAAMHMMKDDADAARRVLEVIEENAASLREVVAQPPPGVGGWLDATA